MPLHVFIDLTVGCVVELVIVACKMPCYRQEHVFSSQSSIVFNHIIRGNELKLTAKEITWLYCWEILFLLLLLGCSEKLLLAYRLIIIFSQNAGEIKNIITFILIIISFDHCHNVPPHALLSLRFTFFCKLQLVHIFELSDSTCEWILLNNEILCEHQNGSKKKQKTSEPTQQTSKKMIKLFGIEIL